MTNDTQKSFRDMDDLERRAEARKYTSISIAMSKCGFAQTAYDHIVRGGTPPRQEMLDFPDKTQGELTPLEEIAVWIDCTLQMGVVGRLTRQDVEARLQNDISQGNTGNPLVRCFTYLNSIGKIPQQYGYLFSGAK